MFVLFCSGLVLGSGVASSDSFQNDPTGFVETLNPHNPRFVTSLARLTKCTIEGVHDPRRMVPSYPADSRTHNEAGTVVMQFIIDGDSCVRKATIQQSSGYYRLDKASLDFAMNLKFPPSVIGQIKSTDDGQPTFSFPIEWKLKPPVKYVYVPGDRCAGAVCTDEAPPAPKDEAMGEPPEPGSVWKPGYYVHYANTGYQWNDGEWQTARPGFHWSAPHWEPFKSRWLFVPGAWERDN